MKELEPLMLVQSTDSNMLGNITSKTPLNYTGTEMAPLFAIAQEESLDAFLARLQSFFESDQVADIPTSAVMELYEYKVVHTSRIRVFCIRVCICTS